MNELMTRLFIEQPLASPGTAKHFQLGRNYIVRKLRNTQSEEKYKSDKKTNAHNSFIDSREQKCEDELRSRSEVRSEEEAGEEAEKAGEAGGERGEEAGGAGSAAGEGTGGG